MLATPVLWPLAAAAALAPSAAALQLATTLGQQACEPSWTELECQVQLISSPLALTLHFTVNEIHDMANAVSTGNTSITTDTASLATINVTLQVDAETSSGWLGLGFTPNGNMVGSQAILASSEMEPQVTHTPYSYKIDAKRSAVWCTMLLLCLHR